MSEWSLAKEKKARGREMRTHNVSQHRLHEGYVGNQKYLVPDANLQVMKELVNMKLGKPPKDRFLREYELTGHAKKVRYESEEEEEDEEEEKEEEKKEEKEEEEKGKEEEEEEKEKEEEKGKESIEETETESTSSSSESSTKTPSVKSERSEKPRATEVYKEPPDPNTLRFLLSGHIRKNSKPIFIIHEYNGKYLFDNESADFTSAKRKHDVDIFVRGKFYGESILEEINGVAKRLLIKPHNILIDERSKIYEDSIQKVFHIGKSEVEIHGSFLKQDNKKNYTPIFRFDVKKASPSLLTQDGSKVSRFTDTSSTREPFLTLGRQVVYLLSSPKPSNDIFTPKTSTNYGAKDKSDIHRKPKSDRKKENSETSSSSKSEVDKHDSIVKVKDYNARLSFNSSH